MDEYESGMDPQVTLYFRKIMKTFMAGLVWFMVVSTAGFFFKLAFIQSSLSWQNIVFYVLLILSFVWLIFYFIKLWRKDFERKEA